MYGGGALAGSELHHCVGGMALCMCFEAVFFFFCGIVCGLPVGWWWLVHISLRTGILEEEMVLL